MKHLKLLLIGTLCVGLLAGCANWSKTAKGGAIGAGAGAAAGAAIGAIAGNTAAGAIIGATVGGTAGALIGRRMDKQAEEMEEDLKDAQVERVGEGIKVTFDSGILFDVNKSDLKAEAKTNIESLATTLQKYDDTEILIAGHTDSSGSEEYNQTLSEKRALSVSDYAVSLGVGNLRIKTVGLGETDPVADNETASGKQQNRRVEVAIFASEKMKKRAQNGTLDVD